MARFKVWSVVESRLIVFCPDCECTGTSKRNRRSATRTAMTINASWFIATSTLSSFRRITVRAASFDPATAYLRERRPDYGLYLDPQWQPPWDHDHLIWPDFGVPHDARPVLKALKFLRGRAHSGQHVEIGCVGGHGRTGTALACLAVLGGTPHNTPWPGSGQLPLKGRRDSRASRVRLLALSAMTEHRPALRVGGVHRPTRERDEPAPDSEPDRQDWFCSASSSRNPGMRPAPKS